MIKKSESVCCGVKYMNNYKKTDEIFKEYINRNNKIKSKQ